MSAMTASPSHGSSHTSARSGRGLPLDEIAYLARRRVHKVETALPTDVLVQRVVARFESTFGTTSRPVDLDGWIRRTLRDIAVMEKRDRRRSYEASAGHTALVETLEALSRPVRAPALANRRKLLLRRVSELIGGPEGRVVFAMITQRSLDEVAHRLGVSPADVARLHRRGLQQLQSRLDADPDLVRQLRDASRQPAKARTAS